MNERDNNAIHEAGSDSFWRDGKGPTEEVTFEWGSRRMRDEEGREVEESHCREEKLDRWHEGGKLYDAFRERCE